MKDQSEHILIDIGHPAHVHLFRNLIDYLNRKQIRHTVTSRKKDVTEALLDHFGIQHTSVSRQATGLAGQFMEFIVRTFRIWRIHRRTPFTLAIGTSVSIGIISLLTAGRVSSYNFCEDDDDAVPLQSFLAYPFSTRIVNPNCIRFQHWGKKRILLPTYHELAYLHYAHFQPDESILKKYRLKPDGYVILRLSSLQAHHDRNEKGISKALIPDICRLAGDRKVIESHEAASNLSVEPWDMIQLLYFANALISDSQTMTAEAAILGTPTIRISSFKSRLSYLEQIESDSLHSFSLYPDQRDDMKHILQRVFENSPSHAKRMASRNAILDGKINLTEWMIGELLERRTANA